MQFYEFSLKLKP